MLLQDNAGEKGGKGTWLRSIRRASRDLRLEAMTLRLTLEMMFVDALGIPELWEEGRQVIRLPVGRLGTSR